MAGDEVLVTPDNILRTLRLLKRKRDANISELQETFNLIGEIETGTSEQFLARCSTLSELRREFRNIQDRIIEANMDAAPTDQLPVELVSKEFDVKYYKIKALQSSVNRIINNTSNPNANTSRSNPNISMASSCSVNQHLARLPKITIPSWNGNMESFQHFFSLYESLIHEGDFSPTVKLTYLRSFLSGQPLSLIENLPLADANYTTAYNLIKNKYGSPRVRATYHLKKLFDFSPLSSDYLKDLQSFLDVFRTNLEAFKNLELEDPYDFTMFIWGLRCLSPNMRTLFERSRLNDDEDDGLPTYDELIKFVSAQCTIKEQNAQFMPSNKLSKPSANSTPNSNKQKPAQSLIVTPSSPPPTTSTSSQNLPFCPLCKQGHIFRTCPLYTDVPMSAKYSLLKKLKKCIRCLGNHSVDDCQSKGRCKICRSTRHHESLHRSNQVSANSSSSSSLVPVDTKTTNTEPASIIGSPIVGIVSEEKSLAKDFIRASKKLPSGLHNNIVMLGTVQAFMKDRLGRWQPIRLVLDSGSQVNLIASDTVQRLGLTVIQHVTPLVGALQSSIGVANGMVSCVVSSGKQHSEPLLTHAVIVNKVCANLPTVSLRDDLYQRFSHLDLADRTFHIEGKIDLLLGAELYASIFQPGFAIIHGSPSAIKTMFGWIIIGAVPSDLETTPSEYVTGLVCGLTLEESVQRFWELEEVAPANISNPTDLQVEQHFVHTHTRDPTSGKYVVRLPFDDSKSSVPWGSSREIAIKRWFNLEKRLRADERLRTSYHEFLKEYLRLGHMALAPSPGKYYIPHFAVVRDSVSSPIRVVFDASCKDSTGTSLNDRLHTGPPLQKDICEVIQHFRLHPIAITADIRMMYRQITLASEDCYYQHIFWRASETEPLGEYQLKTVTYGMKPSPFLAQRVLVQMTVDEGKNYPLASQVLKDACYMDDICYSVADVHQAIQLRNELVSLLSHGGFELRKWASNSIEALDGVPEEHCSTLLQFRTEATSSLHILGVQWNPDSDTFSYMLEVSSDANTKRNILSKVASIFDPLGWVSPLVFWAKVFVRELWTHKLDWDTPLPENLATRWAAFSQQLPCLRDLRIPRLCITPSATNFIIVGFCDASELGYAASLYLRTSSSDQVAVQLLKSKTRVAPLHVQTIQRLELNGAVLLAQLVNSMAFLYKRLSIERTILFTDSATVLCWLHTPPHQLKTFVANRIVKILDLSLVEQWHHVSSHQNAADCASRGLSPSELINHPIWWSGPLFLTKPVEEWPSSHLTLPSIKAMDEMKSTPTVSLTTTINATPLRKVDNYFANVLLNFSSLTRLRRVMAWILRFILNTQREKVNRLVGTLRVLELTHALKICCRVTQARYFAADIKAVSKGQPCSKSLQHLLPFIGEDGLLRVGGRLQHSLLPPATKHPIILPKEAHLSILLCDFYHLQLLHAGPQSVQAAIQKEYWILSLRSLLRQRIWKCLPCLKARAKLQHPVMAELPPERVRPSRAFSATAVDMAGPIMLKESMRRNARSIKVYIAVFVCMSTKAAHLELVGNLSTDSYKAALDRFVSRRGLCSSIHCDNGTNFRGAHNDLLEIRRFLESSEPDLQDYLSLRNIIYKFNPPESPWMGGLWEAAVKSTKRLLSHISTNRLLTYEEMSTLLCRIEAVLNSRPLCRLTSDAGDNPDYLTPGHFLIGAPLLSPPELDLTLCPSNHLSRWQAVQRATQEFWHRWSKEYLNTLTTRPKWTVPRPAMSIGDPVFLMGQNSPPLQWPLGIIEELHPGPDGTARKAVVRTTRGTYLRPVARLVALPPADPPDTSS